MEKEMLYKVLNADGSCYHGGKGRWHLPKGNRPGKWMPKIEGELNPCASGYHVLKPEQLIDWIAPVAIFTVKIRGKAIWRDDKGVASEARLVKRLDTWTEQAARLFACDCAEHLRKSLNAGELAEFDVCLLTIRRYVFGMATEVEMAGAGAWTWTWAGAGAGAWASEKEWNTARLFEYLNGKVDLEAIKRSVTP